jgi:hypothetical protein
LRSDLVVRLQSDGCSKIAPGVLQITLSFIGKATSSESSCVIRLDPNRLRIIQSRFIKSMLFCVLNTAIIESSGSVLWAFFVTTIDDCGACSDRIVAGLLYAVIEASRRRGSYVVGTLDRTLCIGITFVDKAASITANLRKKIAILGEGTSAATNDCRN